jgi:hypothetical protein
MAETAVQTIVSEPRPGTGLVSSVTKKVIAEGLAVGGRSVARRAIAGHLLVRVGADAAVGAAADLVVEVTAEAVAAVRGKCDGPTAWRRIAVAAGGALIGALAVAGMGALVVGLPFWIELVAVTVAGALGAAAGREVVKLLVGQAPALAAAAAV